MTVEEVDWKDLFDAAREGMLGDGAVGRGRITKELRSRGYPDDFLDRAVEADVVDVEDEDGVETYERETPVRDIRLRKLCRS